eukprot:m.176614 g.176614  ORF g.176614 m.176614 type:complete len:120 (+) comp31852_c0_seq1:131-490(+)
MYPQTTQTTPTAPVSGFLAYLDDHFVPLVDDDDSLVDDCSQLSDEDMALTHEQVETLQGLDLSMVSTLCDPESALCDLGYSSGLAAPVDPEDRFLLSNDQCCFKCGHSKKRKVNIIILC